VKSRDKRRKRKKKKAHEPAWERWREATNARLCTEDDVHRLKQEQGLFLLGVMGFAGSWRHAPHKGDALVHWIDSMRQALACELLAYRDVYGDALVVVSGATSMGVLELTYDLCEQHEITAMGITSDRALQYELGQMDYVLPFGRSFGDESDIFVRACDAFVLLGGGQQSARETRSANRQGKVVTVLQGFGGVADEFDSTQLLLARFVKRAVDDVGVEEKENE
jgi:hypothetical protein